MDEHGERIQDNAGNYVFNAVPTTDWGSPDTLEQWRQAWAELCNAKFAEKGLDCRIDHRSYERQGVEQLPTVHEGPTVKAMEQKGIRTDKATSTAGLGKLTPCCGGKAKNRIPDRLAKRCQSRAFRAPTAYTGRTTVRLLRQPVTGAHTAARPKSET